MRDDRREKQEEEIVPGMVVEATEGDLGEQDISRTKITDVKKDAQGHVEAIEIEKGLLFRKKLEVPIDRVQEVDSTMDDHASGDVKIDVEESELEALTQPGEQILSPERVKPQDSLLDQIEQQAPTAEGLREKESNIHAVRPKSTFWRIVGPGLLSGTSGNDPSAVTAYAVDGASVGYGHLWLLLLSTPLYQAVQFACAKIGRVSQHGLSELLREHYGRPMAMLASLLLVITNIALIAADLGAIGSGLELVTGFRWVWFVAPVALVLWYLTVYRNFESFKKIFLTMSFVFVAYIVTAFFSHADWGTVLHDTFVPQIGLDFASISSAVALLGATISPYSMFWQTQGELEEKRTGTLKKQLRDAEIDVGTGSVSGQVVAYFVIISTASTIFIHHGSINTAADAAHALEPLAGPLARYLFAVGLVGSGIVAIPVLLASTSYAVTGAFGWPAGLSKRPWQNEGFYLILTAALVVGLIVALIGIDPIRLIFWANVLAGVMAPLLVITILFVGNNRTIMKGQRLSLLNNIGLVLIAVILVGAVGLLFYGLLTGQGRS
ncbi:MAG: hypothetical protein NVSMB49_16480 [Ktedonobacteraceae bacterium]